MQGFLNNREEFEVWRPISCKWESVPIAGTGRDLFLKVESKFQREKCPLRDTFSLFREELPSLYL